MKAKTAETPLFIEIISNNIAGPDPSSEVPAMERCTDRNGDRWEIYQSANGWRWRHFASNGREVGASTQGYSNRAACIANAQRNGMTCTPLD